MDARQLSDPLRMYGLEEIEAFRKYLNCLEAHLHNVHKAWEEFRIKCGRLSIITDDHMFWSLDGEVQRHDLSKFSPGELLQYRRKFYPTSGESRAGTDEEDAWIQDALDHHIAVNRHHWQSWKQLLDVPTNQKEVEIHCAHLVIDWMATEAAYPGTASVREYYEKVKQDMDLPEWANTLIEEMITMVEAPQDNEPAKTWERLQTHGN